MQNFEKILSNPIKNFLEVEQKRTGIEQEMDPKFFKELKSIITKNSEVSDYMIYYVLYTN